MLVVMVSVAVSGVPAFDATGTLAASVIIALAPGFTDPEAVPVIEKTAELTVAE
jgi:hypothetical protein